MTANDFSPEALRAALQAAEKGTRHAYVAWVIGGFAMSGAGALLFRYADFGQPTHRVIVLTGVLVMAVLFMSLFNLTLRQDAINARMLRALELLHQRLDERDGGRPG